MSENILAGIVTFHPDIERLQDNLAAILPQVDQIVIVDNGSENIDAIKECLGFFEKIYLICNVDNMGIVTALNQIFDYAKVIGKEYVLTLDQDSVVYPDIIAEYRKYFGLENVVSFTSLREDRNFALSQTPKTDEQRIFEEIDQCITSGNLVKISAWECIGGFDERLFIDRVDYDFCYRLRRNGYKIILINKVEIIHELGPAFTVRFAGRERIMLNHSAFRKYYIFRNTVYLIRKYPESRKYFPIEDYLLLFVRHYYMKMISCIKQFFQLKAFLMAFGWKNRKFL